MTDQKCPFDKCNSQGHINGKSPNHLTVASCPNYYNTNNSEWVNIVSREEGRKIKSEIEFIPSEISIHEPSLKGVTSHNCLYQFRRAQQCVVSDPIQEVLQHFETMYRLQEIETSTQYCKSIEDSNVYRIIEIVFGTVKMTTWYQSDYPQSYHCFPKLYICEFCLRYFKFEVSYLRHMSNCDQFYPPGDEIYRYEENSFFEVDGDLHKEYCNRLCLLAKLFLKQKTVSDLDRVVDFDFYILTKNDDKGFHFIGYFSKLKKEKQNTSRNKNIEINSILTYNLSCILVMPPYMRKGYGKLLIDFSYELSGKDKIYASPERPLSDLGLLTYQNYWRNIILDFLCHYEKETVSIIGMSNVTHLHPVDIVSTLMNLDMIKYSRQKFMIVLKSDVLQNHKLALSKHKNHKRIHPEYLDYNRVDIEKEID